MVKKRFFRYESVGSHAVIHWDESCLMGDVLAEIVGLQLSEIIKSQRPTDLVLDFSNVKAISSSVIGWLIRVQNQLRSRGGAMQLAAVSPSMKRIFQTMNLLGTYFEVQVSIEAAINVRRRLG